MSVSDSETLDRMFWSRVEASAGLPAHLVKRGGRWEALDWTEVGTIVRELALGLLALGRRPRDIVGLLSASRAEWVHADFAIFSAGGITVPIYPTYTPEQIAYLVNDAGVRTLIVEDPRQLAKVLEAKRAIGGLEQIIVMQGYEGQDASVLTWEQLRRLGRDHAEALKSVLVERVAATRPHDVATIVYTSGTTGPPKGVVQTHANHIAALRAVAAITPVGLGDVHLLFLPLAHSFARLEAFMGVHCGLTTAFAQSLDALADNLKEVRPHFIAAVPRVFEKVHARIVAGVRARPLLGRKVFAWALDIGREVSRRQQAGAPVPRGLEARRRLAYRLVFAKLHDLLGGRLRFAVSGGAPLSREVAEFFHALGLVILEGYGLTETCPVLTWNRLGRFRFGSAGLSIPGVELRIADDGEILARGPNVAAGYFRNPAATAEAFGPDGWLHTGDIGRIDADGFLFITDRKKDLIVTSGGVNIAPQNVETLLKADPFVSQALLYGDRRPYPVALIALNGGALREFAGRHGLLAGDHARLAHHPTVVERVGRIVDKVNQGLPSYARVKKFAVLPTDLSEEGGELTPTQKVKRQMVAEKYGDLLEGLYRESVGPAA
jgi:long-chain acyl-CoA synthetase